MLSIIKKRTNPIPKKTTDSKKYNDRDYDHHFKSLKSKGKIPYTIGNTKEWNGATYHYCDCPNYRIKIKQRIYHLAEYCTKKY